MAVPAARAEKKTALATVSACSFSLASRWRDTRLPEPIPREKPTAWMMAMMENTMPTAPEALMFSRETKKVSAIL